MAAQEGRRVRARVEFAVLPFSDVDLNEFALKDNGKGKNGHNAFPLVNGEGIRFNLTPTGWLKTPFGFDVQSKFEKPSFLGGKEVENGKPEGLGLRINLEQAGIDFLTALDKKSKQAFLNLAKATWNPLVSENSLFETSSVKVFVVLKGGDDALTKIAVVADDKVVRGEGWDFLKTYIDAGNSFRHAEMKLVVRVKKLWAVSGKAGLKLEATQIVLRPTERPVEANVFADDAELLA